MPSGFLLFSGRVLVRRVLAVLALVSLPVFAGQTLDVQIANYQFTPAEIRIKTGDSVRWLNREKRTSHSVVFPEEGGRESERLFPDESWTREFAVPGRFPYQCGPHPEMQGVVIVE